MVDTVEPNEMLLFKNLAPIWWKENGPACRLHPYNQVRVPYMRDCLIKSGVCNKDYVNTSQPLKGLSILDAGCAAGIMTEAIAKLGCETVGLDPCEDMVTIARGHAALNPDLANLRYTTDSVEEHCITHFEQYDCVVSSEVLEHVTQYEQYLASCIKCLKPGGSLIVNTFNKTYKGWFEGIFLFQYWYKVIPKGAFRWNKFVHLKEVERVMEKYNCKVVGSCGMVWNVKKNQWKLTSDTSVTYGVHAVKL